MMRSSLVLIFWLTVATSVNGSPGQQPLADVVATQPIHTMEGWSYEDCGLSTDPIRIESILVTPDPPQPGKDLIVRVKGTIIERINEGAYADVTVKLGLVKILNKRFDVCEEARNANATIQCPVERGSYILEQTVALPKEIPKAKFTVDVQGYTVEDDDMLCLKLRVDFMKPFPRLW